MCYSTFGSLRNEVKAGPVNRRFLFIYMSLRSGKSIGFNATGSPFYINTPDKIYKGMVYTYLYTPDGIYSTTDLQLFNNVGR